MLPEGRRKPPPDPTEVAALSACGLFGMGLLVWGLGEDTPSAYIVISTSTLAVAVVIWRLLRIVGR